MEMNGFLKVVILILALAIPLSIVFLVYRTLFSGLNSISSSKNHESVADDAAKQEQAQNRVRDEKE